MHEAVRTKAEASGLDEPPARKLGEAVDDVLPDLPARLDQQIEGEFTTDHGGKLEQRSCMGRHARQAGREGVLRAFRDLEGPCKVLDRPSSRQESSQLVEEERIAPGHVLQ